MKRNILIVTSLLIISCHEISAQGKIWTLEDCISYAVTNNIGLQRQRLQNETAEANLLKARMDVLPSLNFGSDARVGFGRSIDPVTNLITFKQNLSNSYSLSSSINIFNGFTALNTIAANKFMMKAGLEAEKITRNTLIINIMGAYYQVLYTKGLENASKMQLDLSERQLFRMQKMVETGREALSRQFEIESQVSTDRLAYTVARNTASQALTSLRQMLQLESGAEFEILMPDFGNLIIPFSIFRTDSIYGIASKVLPRLKAIEYELAASKKQVAAARGNLYPNLTLGGAIYTGYYKVINEGAADQVSFTGQLKNNNSQAVFLSLNIPIFNNYQTGRNIKLARIKKNDTELKLELEKNTLYTEIENACLDLNRGKDEYGAAVSNFEYNKKSFDGVEKKFEAGLVDVTVYAAAKNTLFRAETEALRTRLQMLIRHLTIRFYTTGEYESK
jgi:outer membrane protein